MQRMAFEDAVFLYDDTPNRANTSMYVDLFPETDRPTADLIEWITTRTDRLAVLKKVAVDPYGRIGQPHWARAPKFDVHDHVHAHEADSWSALRAKLLEVRAQPFAENRPPWEFHVIRGIDGVEGQPGRCFAVVTKFHHSFGDPSFFAPVWDALYAADLPPVEADPQPASRLSVTLRELLRLPLWPVMLVADAKSSARAQRHLGAALAESGHRPPPVERCSITAPMGLGVDADAAFFPLDRLRTAARAAGVSANDLILGAIGSAIAEHFDDVGPDVTAFIAVSTREVNPEPRNSVAGGMVRVADDTPWPDRVRRIHRDVRTERTLLSAPEATSSPPRAPGFAYAWFLQRNQRSRQAHGMVAAHTRISSPGRPDITDWRLCGAQPVSRFVVVAPGASCGLCHAVTALGDTVAISAFVDPAQVPDLGGYLDTLRRVIEELCTPHQEDRSFA